VIMVVAGTYGNRYKANEYSAARKRSPVPSSAASTQKFSLFIRFLFAIQDGDHFPSRQSKDFIHGIDFKD
jgi:hypothetical protein